MKKIVTIATGTEIMLGQTLDRDFNHMASKLAQFGHPIHRHYVVGDDFEELQKVFIEALDRSDILILSGGLGPTTDDLTRDVVSDVLRRPLSLNAYVLKGLVKKFEMRKLPFPESAKQQALVLEGAQVIPNKYGTAPGMYVEQDDKKIFLLPGPPHELIPMFDGYILPRIKEALDFSETFKFLTLRTFGIRESSVQELMNQAFKNYSDFLKGLGYCSAPAGVDVRIAAKQKDWEKILPFVNKVKEILKPWTYAHDDETLEEIVARLLISKGETLAVAESCTGGLFSERLTRVPGISKVFKLGIVTYSNESKINLLGVSAEDLKHEGAVSGIVASQMAQGILRKGASSIGLSITGIAGPSGGTVEKPVGLVWIGIHSGQGIKTLSHHFIGTREIIQFKASQAALDMLRRVLTGDRIDPEEVV